MKTDAPRTRPATTLLGIVFFLSGFAALVYQVVWQRLLTVHYGVGAVAITLIVSVYMLGLGMGALVGGYLAERVRARLFLYCAIELGLGVFGLASLPLLQFLGRATAGSAYPVALVCMFAFLAIPTCLMGMTLPLLTKIFNRVIDNFFETVSFLYFINTLGAAFGALAASYLLISFIGLDGGVYTAAATNFLLAVLILAARRLPVLDDVMAQSAARLPAERLGRVAYALVFVTGFMAIGYEIIWFRLVEVIVKSSPYAFSVVLSIYLLGIALGSRAMRHYLSRRPDAPRVALFFRLQSYIALYVLASVIAYYLLTQYTGLALLTRASFEGVTESVKESSPLVHLLVRMFNVGDIFVWPLVFVLVPTIFMGATFPLIAALALADARHEAKTVGAVYFSNILGNVAGGIVTGFVLLPLLKTELTCVLFVAVGIVLGRWGKSAGDLRLYWLARPSIVLALLTVVVLFFPRRGELYVAMHPIPAGTSVVEVEEGVDGVSVVCQRGDVVYNWINGRFQAEYPDDRSYFQAIEAAAFAPAVRNVLVIGYGTGSTTEAALRLDGLESLTLVEVSESLVVNLKKLDLFREMLADPRLRLVIDDGRRLLLQEEKRYDLILMDPLNARTSYSNNIYSREFFELAASRLNPGGILYVYTTEHRALPKTVAAVFPYVRMYERCCLASNTPLVEHDGRRDELLAKFSPERQALILEKGQSDQYLGDSTFVDRLTRGYSINRDWRPVCEYWIGLRARELVLGEASLH